MVSIKTSYVTLFSNYSQTRVLSLPARTFNQVTMTTPHYPPFYEEKTKKLILCLMAVRHFFKKAQGQLRRSDTGFLGEECSGPIWILAAQQYWVSSVVIFLSWCTKCLQLAKVQGFSTTKQHYCNRCSIVLLKYASPSLKKTCSYLSALTVVYKSTNANH